MLMFLGRVGFLSLLLAFQPAQPPYVRLSEEKELLILANWPVA